MKKFLSLIFITSSAAYAKPPVACENFAGVWKGTCQPDSGKSFPLKYTVLQNACDTIEFIVSEQDKDVIQVGTLQVKNEDWTNVDGSLVTSVFVTDSRWSETGKSLIFSEDYFAKSNSEEGAFRQNLEHTVSIKDKNLVDEIKVTMDSRTTSTKCVLQPSSK